MALNLFRAILETVQDFIAPPLCVLCRQYSEQLLCPSCLTLLEKLRIRPTRCYRCGAPMYGRKCKRCHGIKLPYTLARGAYLYTGPVAHVVEAMKYHGFRSLISWMANQMLPLMEEFTGQLLVPIPLHPTRIRERGFSQTKALVQALSQQTGLPVGELLERTRHTRSQTTLEPQERLRNVRGAFQARVFFPEPVILVDDVMTTGATIKEAAKILLKSGVPRVEVLVFAITP